MATKNGVTPKIATTKEAVKKQLTHEAKKPTAAKKVQEQTVNPAIELASRIEKFEKLKGLCNNREKLNNTLSELLKFTYNNDGSALFFIRSNNGEYEFKTTNSNLIKLVSSQLQKTLEERRQELNTQIMAFEL